MSLNYKSPMPQSPVPIAMYYKPAYLVTLNFIRANHTWSIDSAYTYCIREYAHLGITQAIFSEAVRNYILEK